MEIRATLRLHFKRLCPLVLIILLFSLQVYAQDEQKELETDRPDETEAASVVPVRTIQVETGFYFQKNRQQLQDVKILQYPVALVRVGLLSWLELRVQSAWQENRVSDEAMNSEIMGFAPLTLGTKLALWEERGIRPQAAFMIMVDLPVGSRELRPKNPDPSLRFMFKNTLTEHLDLNYNLVYAWEDGQPIKGYAVSVGAALNHKLTIYAEVFGDKLKNENITHNADTGILFLVTPTLQLDLAAGTPFNSFGQDYFFTTGVSFRLPN